MTSFTRSIQSSQSSQANSSRSGDIEAAIRGRLEKGGKAFVPFLTAGFPNEKSFIDALRVAAGSGSDVIEVGIPFSDPIADGPTIQWASQHCLERGMTMRRALESIHQAAVSVPVVLMSYANPLLSFGCDRLVRDGRAVGVRGIVVPDLPLSHCPKSGSALKGNGPTLIASHINAGGLDLVLLSAPTTDRQRLSCIGHQTQGFLYAVTLTGVTGMRTGLQKGAVAFLRRTKSVTPRPVLAGFGIANSEQASRVAAHCDGVIVGSALIELLRQQPKRTAVRRLERFIMRMRKALDD